MYNLNTPTVGTKSLSIEYNCTCTLSIDLFMIMYVEYKVADSVRSIRKQPATSIHILQIRTERSDLPKISQVNQSHFRRNWYPTEERIRNRSDALLPYATREFCQRRRWCPVDPGYFRSYWRWWTRRGIFWQIGRERERGRVWSFIRVVGWRKRFIKVRREGAYM